VLLYILLVGDIMSKIKNKISEYILNIKLNKLTNNIGKCIYEDGKITCFVDKNSFSQYTNEKLILKIDTELASSKLNKPIKEINYIFKDFYFYYGVYISNQINKNEVKVNVEFINCVFFNCINIFDMNNLLFNDCVQSGKLIREGVSLQISGIKKTTFNNSKFNIISVFAKEFGIEINSEVVEMKDTKIFDRKKINIFASNKLSLKNSLISCSNKIDISAFTMDYIDSDINALYLIELHTYSFIDYKKLNSPKIMINGVCVKSSVKEKLIIDLLNQFNQIIEKSNKESIYMMYPPVLEDISKKKKLLENLLIDLNQIKSLAENNFEIEINKYKEELKNKSLTKIIKK